MSNTLEIGPGRGDFLFRLAEENPLGTIHAIEYKRKRYDKLVGRLETKGLSNVRLYLGDARIVLPAEFAEEFLEKVFILFSDPWPKRRHAKHRLFQETFVRELHRVLKPDGRIFIAHDNPGYLEQIREVFGHFAAFFIQEDDGTQFPTFYAEKWKKEGRTIFSFSYRKINCKTESDCLRGPCDVVTADETA